MPDKKSGFWEALRFPVILGLICGLAGLLLGLVYGLTKEAIERGRKSKLAEALKELVPDLKDFDEQAGPAGGEFIYRLYDRQGQLIAYAAQTVGKDSYNKMKPIRVVTALDTALSATLGVRVIESEETPGLGERIKDRRKPNTLLGLLLGRPDRRLVLETSGECREFEVASADEQGVTVIGPDGKKRVLPGARALDFPPTFQEQFSRLAPDELSLKKAGGRIEALTGATISSCAVLEAAKRAACILAEAYGKGR